MSCDKGECKIFNTFMIFQVECQSGLAAAAVTSRKRSVHNATYKKLRQSWKQVN